RAGDPGLRAVRPARPVRARAPGRRGGGARRRDHARGVGAAAQALRPGTHRLHLPRAGLVGVDVAGAVAAIAGGASGMARATALDLAKGGARIAILDLASSAGEKVAAELGGEAIFCPMDIRDSASIARALDRTLERFGALHIGVN